MFISIKSVTFAYYPMQIRDNLSKNGSNLDINSLSKCGRKCGRECDYSTEKLSERLSSSFLNKTKCRKPLA